MKRYLLQITRNIRAERPSEEQIVLDSTAADENRWGDISQNVADDNFFILSAEYKIEYTLIKLLAIDNLHSPAKILNNEGYGIVEYPYSEDLTFATSLRPGSSAVVQYGTETTESSNTYGTLAEALAYIGGLDESDGYILIDQNPSQQVPSQVMSSRPSLWYGTSFQAPRPPIILQPNFLGRTDADRA